MARLVALLLFASSLPAQMLDITVTDSVTRAPMPGIIVTLLGPDRYDGMTDDFGVLHVGPVQRGKYMLNIVKSGYILPPAGQASFPVDSDKRLSVELDPLCLVDGRVQYPDGRPRRPPRYR